MLDKRLGIIAASAIIENAKQRRYVFPILLMFFRYVRLCLLAFVVHYLDIKFKVERGTRKKQKRGTKEKKARVDERQAVSCCFSYHTVR
jgi:hypothetical protein